MSGRFDRNVRIGFVGLGIMGVPIVQRLRDEGYAITAWNLEPERFDLVREHGVVWADSPRAVWESSDLVFVCVLGDHAVDSVCFGENGFAKADGGGASVLVDLSTTSPEATLKFAPHLQEALGAQWVDAPMSGGPQAAREGKITLMIGGDEETGAAVSPVLNAISSNLTRMGTVGAGQKTKVLNQAIVGVNYVLMAELLATARAAGIDPSILPGCLEGGMADSVILQRIFTQMAAEDFSPPRSYARQLNKDLKAVSAFVKSLRLDLPVVETAVDRYRTYAEAGNEMEDGASVSRLYQKK